MAIGIGPGLGVTRGGGARLKPGQAFLSAVGSATTNFLAQTAALFNASGTASASFIGAGGSAGGSSPTYFILGF